jgi:hypothetical protein
VYNQAESLICSSSRGTLLYNHFEGFGNDHQSHEDAHESGLEAFRTPTPGALAAHSYEMLNQPSVEFTRQTWWESLTRYYGGPRALATRRIVGDLSHLLVLVTPIFFIWAEIFPVLKFSSLQLLYCIVRSALHSILEDVPLTLVFLRSINVPLFFSTFHHPDQREHVQPSLVLAMLALSTLIQSGDLGLRQKGRLKACKFPSTCQC